MFGSFVIVLVMSQVKSVTSLGLQSNLTSGTVTDSLSPTYTSWSEMAPEVICNEEMKYPVLTVRAKVFS